MNYQQGGNCNSSRKSNKEPLLLLQRTLERFCASDALSEVGLRKIIERSTFTPNYNKNRFLGDYKFFYRVLKNVRLTEGIINYILTCFPEAAREFDRKFGVSALRVACRNKNVTPQIVRLLIDAHPDSVHKRCSVGLTVLHIFCANRFVDIAVQSEILDMLLSKCSMLPRLSSYKCGSLPIHVAAGEGYQSPEFCQKLIRVFPGSERAKDDHGILPIHHAVFSGAAATVKYLYKLYPEGINPYIYIQGWYGLPIQCSLAIHRKDTETVVEIIQFIMKLKPWKINCAQLLVLAAVERFYESNVSFGIQVNKTLFDAFPEEITAHPKKMLKVIVSKNFNMEVRRFLSEQFFYAIQAKNHHFLKKAGKSGWLPLHTALHDNKASLGSIKLLVKGYPSALRHGDSNGLIPLHVACEYHDSPMVVQCLIDHETSTLSYVDKDGNTAIHHACRGAKHETIALLLKRYHGVSISTRNLQEKLPIELLFESSKVVDRESVQYMESVFRLLRAHPDTVKICKNVKQNCAAAVCPSQNAKKRKVDMTTK
jgi:ankyrin repeat protein